MKKNFKFSLLKSFFDFDLLFVNNKKINKILFNKKIYDNNSFNFRKKSSFILDPVVLCKTLKQFTRLLKFVTKRKLFRIYIITKTQKQFDFLNYFLKKDKDKKSKLNRIRFLKERLNLQRNKKVIYLGINFGSKLTQKKLHKLLYYGIFLNCTIQNEFLDLMQGYKINNSVNDMKKFIFFSLFIKNSINKDL